MQLNTLLNKIFSQASSVYLFIGFPMAQVRNSANVKGGEDLKLKIKLTCAPRLWNVPQMDVGREGEIYCRKGSTWGQHSEEGA